MIPSVTVLSFVHEKVAIIAGCHHLLKEDKHTPKWKSDHPVPETKLSYLLVLAYKSSQFGQM